MTQTKDKLAQIISTIASPFITIVVFGLLVIHAYSQTTADFLNYSILFILLTVLLPFIWIYIGVKTGKFTDLHVMIREQRTEPFIVAIIGAMLLLVIYYFIGAPMQLVTLAVTMIINGIVFIALTMMWKLSMHAAALSASVLIATLLINPLYALFFLLVPVVIWARLVRKRHSLGQGVVAIIIVLVVTFITIKVFGF